MSSPSTPTPYPDGTQIGSSDCVTTTAHQLNDLQEAYNILPDTPQQRGDQQTVEDHHSPVADKSEHPIDLSIGYAQPVELVTNVYVSQHEHMRRLATLFENARYTYYEAIDVSMACLLSPSWV